MLAVKLETGGGKRFSVEFFYKHNDRECPSLNMCCISYSLRLTNSRHLIWDTLYMTCTVCSKHNDKRPLVKMSCTHVYDASNKKLRNIFLFKKPRHWNITLKQNTIFVNRFNTEAVNTGRTRCGFQFDRATGAETPGSAWITFTCVIWFIQWECSESIF